MSAGRGLLWHSGLLGWGQLDFNLGGLRMAVFRKQPGWCVGGGLEPCLSAFCVAVCLPRQTIRALEADGGLSPGASVCVCGVGTVGAGRHKGLVYMGGTPSAHRDCADQI